MPLRSCSSSSARAPIVDYRGSGRSLPSGKRGLAPREKRGLGPAPVATRASSRSSRGCQSPFFPWCLSPLRRPCTQLAFPQRLSPFLVAHGGFDHVHYPNVNALASARLVTMNRDDIGANLKRFRVCQWHKHVAGAVTLDKRDKAAVDVHLAIFIVVQLQIRLGRQGGQIDAAPQPNVVSLGLVAR